MNDPSCYLSNWSVKGAWLARETIVTPSLVHLYMHGMTECAYHHMVYPLMAGIIFLYLGLDELSIERLLIKLLSS